MTLLVRRLAVSIGDASIVHDVDFEVEEGEFVGLVGPNGAGKTTVLRAITGALPSTGTVEIRGDSLDGMGRSQRARSIALVPQRPVVPPGITVLDYVLLGRTPHLHLLESESAGDIATARAGLESLDMARFGHRRLDSLSGGEIQRVTLARALTQGSSLLLLDEPTSSLDVGHAQRVLGLVDDLRHTSGVTVLAAIHDLTLASQFCDRLVMMAAGTVVADGHPSDVLTAPSIADHYGATVRVLDDGAGRVAVIPVRPGTSEPADARMDRHPPPNDPVRATSPDPSTAPIRPS